LASVTFDGVGKVFPDGTRAVDDLSLEVRDGEFMVFVGPSGCGKTTALRMVAGLEDVTEGTIMIGDTVANTVHPRERDIAMVFQNYALYPHMSVADNIAFGLRMRKVPKAEAERRVREIAGVLRLTELMERRPRALSGGQRQRVAMGRAIVRNPRVLLMDEPLSNLDAKLRVQMRAEIARIQGEIQATTVYVTHDQVEAMTMGDRVVVLRKGQLQQVDVPQRLYETPVNLFVASFMGSPSMNLMEARVEREGDALVCLIGEQRLSLAAGAEARRPALADYLGRTIGVGIRSEHVHDAALDTGAPEERRLRGEVDRTELLGSDLLAYVEIDAAPLVTAELMEVAADIDAATADDLAEEAERHRALIVGRFEVQSRARVGNPIEIVIDTEQLHFFDLETGLAIPPAG
jgi:multiple sugar transport system ATP-binding protein